MPTTRPIESLEPRRLLAAETYDWTSATIKGNGFIDGIVYHPTEAGLVYIHTDMGGAYRYDTSRSRWTPLTDFARYNDSASKSMGVETLAVDPTDADRLYMGIGTYMQPSAILRSSDRGQTFQQVPVPFEMNGNGSGRNAGERMRVDPNSPNILFYGSRDDGLWKSSDRAVTWTRVTSFPTIGLDSGFGQDTGILFVDYDKTSSTAGTATQTIYVGVFDPTAGVPRIYRSTDAGATWGALAGGQPTTANLFPQRSALTPDGKTLYLTYATSTIYAGPYGLSNGQVWKVTNPGSATPTWTNITPPTAYSYSAITLDPTNPNLIYVGEMGNYSPADRIWRSGNGGASWIVSDPNSKRDDSSAPYAKSQRIHWLGDLQIDPLNRNVGMITTGYGLYRTTNLATAAPNWTFFNEGFEQSAILEFASPNAGPVNLFSAIGDRDGYRHADFSQSPVEGVLGQNNGMQRGTSDDIDVAWNDANTLVRVVRSNPYVQVSTDNGITWSWLNATGVTGGDGGSLAISGDGTRVVYEPAGAVGTVANRLLYSTRSGTTWSAWSAPATNTPPDGARLTVDLVNGMTFYAQAGSTISRSTDGGVNWTVMTTSAPSNIKWTRAVPNNAGHLLVAAEGNGLYRSINGGATWNRVAANNVTHAYAVGVGAAAPGKTYPALFIAGSANATTGFFRSDDAGATWITVSDAEHQFGSVIVIQGDPRVFGRLYVGSNGRGVLVGDPLSTPSTLPTGWRRDDVGGPALAGNSGASGSTFTLAGTGASIGGSTDQFHFASSTVGGDVTITARLENFADTGPTAQAGLMIRAGGEANAAFAMVGQLANGKVVFTWRTAAGQTAQATVPEGVYATLKHLRLSRVESTFVASYSTDGSTWISVGSPTTIPMPVAARVGLAATSANSQLLAKATFANVVIAADTTPPTVVSASFDFLVAALPAVQLVFSEDVSADLSLDDLSLINSDTGATVAALSLTFDPATLTARFQLPSDLPIGNYRASLPAGSVADRAGNPLASPAAVDFFHLPGDINRDRAVDFGDLVILAQHYNQPAASFAEGDLTGDGTVGFGDLVVLAQRYGQSVRLPPSTAAVAVASLKTVTSRQRSKASL